MYHYHLKGSVPKSFESVPLAVSSILVFTALLLLYFANVRYRTPLRKIPGPFLASFTRLWKVWTILKARQELKMIDLHREHGPVVRIGPNEVSVSEPTALKVIYGAGSAYRKTKWYPTWNMAGKSHKWDIFSDPTVEGHAANKRLVSNSYSMNAVSELESFIQRPIDRLLERMEEHAANRKQMSFSDWMQWFAFDVIGEVSFSQQFGFLEQGKDIDDTLKSIDDMLWSGIVIAEIPELYDFSQSPYLRMIPIVGKYGAKLNFIIEKALGFIAERRQGKSVARRDLLSRFFQIEEENPTKFDALDVQILATLNVFAGSDTTSIALRAVFYYLMTTPRSFAKLREELDTAVRDGTLSHAARYAEAQRLPYLQACIKEAMRLHPSLGTQHTRLVPEGGVTINGAYLPANTIVGINAWVMHRQKAVFGEDAHVYRPERWLEGNKALMERHFMTFGYGAHMCLGKNIALLEITKLVPQVVRRFDLQLAHPEDGGWMCRSNTFVSQKNFDVICKTREKSG